MRVLIVVSQKGFWAEELLKPMDRLDEAGIPYDFAVPYRDELPFPDGGSEDATYVDPPLHRPVTSQKMADRAKAMDWKTLFAARETLQDWFPIRPYISTNQYLDELEKYYEKREDAWKERIKKYDALLLVGGSGPVVDMVNNPRLHDLILGFYYAAKPIAAECYAVTCLAFARELDTRQSILRGKHVTGHAIEYDYTSNWQVTAGQGTLVFNSPPYPLEYILRDAVGPDGMFHGNIGRATSVVVDYPFITSRSVESSDLCGIMLVKVLREGLKHDW